MFDSHQNNDMKIIHSLPHYMDRYSGRWRKSSFLMHPKKLQKLCVLPFLVRTPQRMVRGCYVGLWSWCEPRLFLLWSCLELTCACRSAELSRGGKLNGVYKLRQINQEHQQFKQRHEEGTVDISGKVTKFNPGFKYIEITNNSHIHFFK